MGTVIRFDVHRNRYRDRLAQYPIAPSSDPSSLGNVRALSSASGTHGATDGGSDPNVPASLAMQHTPQQSRRQGSERLSVYLRLLRAATALLRRSRRSGR